VIEVKKVKPSFVDGRGAITSLIDRDKAIRSVQIITSKPGAIRANHYHKKDWHYVYMLEGEMEYSEKSMADPKAKIETVTLVPGDLVLTRPMTAHAMKFLRDSTFLALATELRSQDEYEADTVRIELVK